MFTALRLFPKSTWALGTLGTASAGVYAYSKTDEGIERSLEFWRNILPIYFRYRFVQFLNEDIGFINDDSAGARYLDLHNRYTDEVKLITYKLRGYYLKSAQLMSTQDDFIPEAYMSWLKNTQDNVPSEFKDAKQVRKYVSDILKSELNKDFDEVFETFDYTPIGVASIGQVHKATLKGSGEQVAVKLQLPNMESRFRADVSTIKMFCKLATPQFVPTFDEIERQFCTEFDYLGEAQNLHEIRRLVLPRWGDQVAIPRPYLSLCSRHLLTMEYLDGVKVVDGVRAQFKALAGLSGDSRSLEEIEAERVQAIRDGTMRLLSLEEADRQRQQLAWGVFVKDWIFSFNPLRFVYNHTVCPLTGSETWGYVVTLPAVEGKGGGGGGLQVDLGRVLRLLCDVHASEIFEAGSFNADPHPGNIILMPNGKIGLIDYGQVGVGNSLCVCVCVSGMGLLPLTSLHFTPQVKSMTLQDRITYAKLILALHRDDKAEIVRLYTQEGGMRSREGKAHVAYLHACFYNDRDTPDVTMGKNMHLFAEYLEQQDPIESLPENFIMAGRVTLLLRGMAKAFGLHIKMSDMWKGEAERFLRSQGIDY